jgi:stage IV sporulation protein FB
MSRNRVTVSGGLMILAATAIFFDAGRLFTLVAIAAAAHETGHFLALRRAGCHVDGVRIGLTGFAMEYSGALSYKNEALTAAAGPAAGAALTLVAAAAGRALWLPVLGELAAVSALLSAFNLLPVFPMDGGRILYAICAMRAGERVAARIVCVCSCAGILVMLVAGANAAFRTGNNFTLLAAAAWLLAYYADGARRRIIG